LETNIFYPALGLAGEAGEVANKVKKVIRDDKSVLTEERRADIMDECSDVLWYLASLTEELGYTLEQIGQHNLDKLSRRKTDA
jgi:NTP pyrophosphatase (non-canonical NTP hydrolase)